MQKRKQFTLGIITLLLLCILAGCQFGNQKKKTEKKVDYYIGVVDNNAPYYYKDAYGRAKTEKVCYETENYPENVMITNFEEYDFQLRHPDRIVIQCPYDEYNYGITIHPFFYAKNLVKYTEDLVYIPGLLMDEAGDEGDRQRYNLKSYCNMPGVVYADHVIVQSGQMQKAYVELLTEFAGEDTRSIWEKKISFFPDKL